MNILAAEMVQQGIKEGGIKEENFTISKFQKVKYIKVH
jgi:hypothetical protein